MAIYEPFTFSMQLELTTDTVRAAAKDIEAVSVSVAR